MLAIVANHRYSASIGVAVLLASAAVIFVLDLRFLPRHSPGFGYAAVVLIALWLPWRRSSIAVALALSPLIILGSFAPLFEPAPGSARANVGVALAVVWLAAFVVGRMAESTAQLDGRIRERTRALTSANEALRVENAARLEADRELRRREAYLRQLILILVLDPVGRIVEWNREAELIHGVSKAEALSLESYARLAGPQTLEASIDEFRRLMEGGAPIRNFENTIRRPDGEERVLLWSGAVLRDPEGGVLGVLGSGVDVTELKRTEREREERLRFEELIVDLSARLADPTVTDVDPVIHDGLRGLGELIGADRCGIGFFDEESGKLIGGHLWRAPEFDGTNDPVPDRQSVLDKMSWLSERLRRGEDLVVTRADALPEEAVFEQELLESVGGASAAFVPMIVGGKVMGCLSLALVEGRDRVWPEPLMKRLRLVAGIIGGELARRRTEEQLRLVMAETQAILDTAADGIVTVRPDGTVETFSPGAERIFGYSAHEVVGQSSTMLWTPEQRARAAEDSEEETRGRLAGRGSRGEILHQRKDGTLFPAHLTLGAIEVGGKLRYTGFVRDLTEQKAMEQRLRAAASEAALAEQRERKSLAGDLHDGLGQLLSLANMKLGGLRSEVETAELRSLVREVEEVIGEADRRTTSLTFQLSPPVLDDVGLVAAAEWLAEDLERQYGLRVELTGDRRTAPLDEAARVTLFRAARELLINVAKHAEVDQALLDISHGEGLVRVSVEDCGIGFDLDEGADGFGLLSLRDRLQHLGGSLEIESAPGSGSRITALVPELRSGESAPR
ncbi:MAG: PAS domain S-box protein [Deltaproteobacteria bacterium]|nr:PAS domain S-box protein [Deltaproteobacteria bacterium]